ncbi:MAG: hypothetical protein Kow00124_03290 [Anaerolineae bacterium]
MSEKKEEQVPREPSEFTAHVKAACKAFANQWRSLIPQEFWSYRREAKRELLLAMRAVVDGAIERLDPQGETPPSKPRSRGSRKVKVEVE